MNQGSIWLAMDGPPAILAVIEADLELIGRLRNLSAEMGVNIVVTRSAEEAILYLRGVGVYSNRLRYPLPSAILLDTGSAAGSDLNVLAWLRENSDYFRLPVGILTEEDAHDLHVLCALDPASFLIDRKNLAELAALILVSCYKPAFSSAATPHGPQAGPQMRIR